VPEPTEEQRQPSEMEQFSHALRQDLGQFSQNVSQRLNAIEQRVAQPAQPSAQPQAAPNLSELERINAQLRERVISDPLGYTKEVIGTATQQASAAARQIIEDERRMQQLSTSYQNFWAGFSQYNTDVAAFGAQVEANLRSGGVDAQQMISQGRSEELSRYADQAANQIRGAIAQRIEWEKQTADRQRNGARQASGGQGGNYQYGPQGSERAPESRDPKAELQEAVDDLAAQRNKKMWDKIDTPEYRDQARTREDRVKQDRYVANGRR